LGVGLTVGALLAVAGLVVAATVTRPTIGRLVTLAGQASDQGPPSAERTAAVGALQQRLAVAERVSLVMLVLAVVAMSSARYL
jgi:hypothetical protein